jgi:hypothetical protein
VLSGAAAPPCSSAQHLDPGAVVQSVDLDDRRAATQRRLFGSRLVPTYLPRLQEFRDVADKDFAAPSSSNSSPTSAVVCCARPQRRTAPPRSAGRDPPVIESVFDTPSGRLSLERHGARTMPALIAPRLLTLAAGLRHTQLAGTWDRRLIAYDHSPWPIGIDQLAARPSCAGRQRAR